MPAGKVRRYQAGTVYDPEEPPDVEIDSLVQLEILPLLFIAIGAVGFILSALD